VHPAIEGTLLKFNGSLNFQSVYKGTPRKELDDAWDALSPGSSISSVSVQMIAADQVIIVLPGPTLAISEEELKLIGKDSTADATVKIPSHYGGGYYATLEVFHQLHCLVCFSSTRIKTLRCCLQHHFQNLVRMATYKDHYDLAHAFGDRPRWLRKHIGE
jgi:hypothetical protein